MEMTGILRRTDDLGRIMIPKEIRRQLEIKEGQPLEFFTEGDMVIMRKSDTQDGDKLPQVNEGLLVETPLGVVCVRETVMLARGVFRIGNKKIRRIRRMSEKELLDAMARS